ncbi:hypothetical protein JCM9140_2531 [Halalkalibacter wakoensis JCM 9140]|uniref:Uncharacterized protein n=1 Tax=Halalkalibacter wakoensis JCM 9140 TaxID=1236970 RepID=W4Q3B6_9BACI|nr:hypothetical protein [Halalkalibacter wakoensis]GAE26462.1 hypothetical protein JCM9140_2531 [Halalkalibacter wakoensis JCM 9140]
MWEGFIKYNDARTSYLLHLVHENSEDNWQEIMNEALSPEIELQFLIKDIIDSDKDSTYLYEAFVFEKLLANLTNLNIQIVENKDVTDPYSRTKYRSPNYQGMLQDPILKEESRLNKERISKYQQDIMGHGDRFLDPACGSGGFLVNGQ